MPKSYGKRGGASSIEIEAGDKRNFTMVPNYVLRSGCKANEVAVLAVIASYAWEGSRCTASAATIAEAIGVKRSTVIQAIRAWEERGQLKVERVKGSVTRIKTAFDYTAEAAPWGGSAHRGTGREGGVVPAGAQGVVPIGAPEEDKEKKTKKENLAADAAGERKDQDIVDVFDAFKLTELWPIPNYGNRTEREAARKLIQRFGVDELVGMIARFAEAAGRDKFLPKGHKPSQFLDNLGLIASRMKAGSGKKQGAIQSL